MKKVILIAVVFFGPFAFASKSLNNLTLSIRYPGKQSQFEFKKKEISLTIDGQLAKSRAVLPKDISWLQNTVSTIDFKSTNPTTPCELGEIILVSVENSQKRSIRKCLGTEDKNTKKLVVLTQTLHMFL